jgi:D-alanyl-D-alanine carboxypeptidase/D-alanyl-D-alanine-endopeptidase (penicillin-binding protein 4)
MRVGPQPEDDEPEPAPRRRRRRPVLITLVALVAVVGIAAGVVFVVPGLSDRLGLTSAGPVATSPPPAPVDFSPGLRAPDAAAPAPSPAGVAAALAGPTGESGLGNLTGIVLDPATGQALWESDANTPLVPASTTKLLTAAAALLSLDPAEELVTKVVEGATPGEVIIVGGGDLTVSSLEPGQESVYPGAAYLADLVEQVRASGVAVNSVQVDLTLYTGESLAPGWLAEDINAHGVGYITRMVPVMLDGDRGEDPTNVDGVRTGNPGRHMAEAFASRIGASVPGTVEATAPASARVLGEIRSAPLVELVYTMLTTSDNMLAEVVAHEVARGAGEEVSFAGAAKATMDLLRQNGFNVDGAELSDGSGMSTQNQVPARLLGEILAVAAAPDGADPRTAKLRPMLAGLPVAGGTGTLDDAHNRFNESGTTAARGWARAKTGTLSGVNSLAGIVLDTDGRLLVFALMTSDSVSDTARPALDGIVAALRRCGCQ